MNHTVSKQIYTRILKKDVKQTEPYTCHRTNSLQNTYLISFWRNVCWVIKRKSWPGYKIQEQLVNCRGYDSTFLHREDILNVSIAKLLANLNVKRNLLNSILDALLHQWKDGHLLVLAMIQSRVESTLPPTSGSAVHDEGGMTEDLQYRYIFNLDACVASALARDLK